MRKIIKNAIQCKLCGDIIESTYCHDYVECKCGACVVDGGHQYLRRGFKEEDMVVIADAIKAAVIDKDEEKAKELVKSLTDKYPLI